MKIAFEKGCSGILDTGSQKIHVGDQGISSKELMQASIGVEAYSCFLKEMDRRHLSMNRCIVEADGDCLNSMKIVLRISSDEREADLKKAFAASIGRCGLIMKLAETGMMIDADVKKSV